MQRKMFYSTDFSEQTQKVAVTMIMII